MLALSAGSECVYQMLKAIWPSIATVPNKLNGNITTTGMMCYFLFWLLQLPFLIISAPGLRWLFMIKAVIVPPALLAMLIWAFTTPGSGHIFQQQGTLSGATLVWAWLGALNSTLGGFAPLAVNIPDFTRYARSERESEPVPSISLRPALLNAAHIVNIFSSSLSQLHSLL